VTGEEKRQCGDVEGVADSPWTGLAGLKPSAYTRKRESTDLKTGHHEEDYD
jgi:hypothetical protein